MKLIFLLLSFAAFGAEAPVFKKLVVIGDSITEGYGVSRELSYPALVQKKIDGLGKKWRVLNGGISGSTSASAPSRVEWYLKQKPDMILLALGANDGLRGSPVKAMEENLSRAVETAQKAKVPIVLAGMRMPPNYGAKYTADFQAAFKRVADKLKVPFIPFLLEGVAGRADMNLADAIHPNEKGHQIVAENVFNAIKKDL